MLVYVVLSAMTPFGWQTQQYSAYKKCAEQILKVQCLEIRRNLQQLLK